MRMSTARSRPRTPIVSTKHNPDPFRTGRWRHAERRLARRARRIVAISEAVRRFSVKDVGLPAEKIDVVHYGLDALPEPWAPNPPLAIDDGAPLLLCVARLTPQKGVDVAIRALPEVPGATLVVLGEGPERASLEALGRELGVAERVLMPGRVGDVAELYRRSDVLVHPARWEGFGLAMLEAMLAGKPVAAVDAGSAPELVLNGSPASSPLPTTQRSSPRTCVPSSRGRLRESATASSGAPAPRRSSPSSG